MHLPTMRATPHPAGPHRQGSFGADGTRAQQPCNVVIGDERTVVKKPQRLSSETRGTARGHGQVDDRLPDSTCLVTLAPLLHVTALVHNLVTLVPLVHVTADTHTIVDTIISSVLKLESTHVH